MMEEEKTIQKVLSLFAEPHTDDQRFIRTYTRAARSMSDAGRRRLFDLMLEKTDGLLAGKMEQMAVAA